MTGVTPVVDGEDYRTAKVLPVNTASSTANWTGWRRDGGHEDRSNMKHFIAWANKLIKHTPPAMAPTK